MRERVRAYSGPDGAAGGDGRQDGHDDGAASEIERHADRMRRSRRSPIRSPLAGLGVFGLVGWTVVIPTLGGALFGHWLDRTWPQAFSWTLALLLAGAVVGAAVAWRWVERERKE